MSSMGDPNADKFIVSLVKTMQMVCHGFMEFTDNIEIVGHINLRIDNHEKFDYILNEHVSKQGGESTVFHSNSYHSLPPPKCAGGERFSSKGEEDGSNVNNHHRLDEGFGGGRVQVDLSGATPITRSTSAPSHDGYFSMAGGNSSHHRGRSQSRESRLHSVAEEQAFNQALHSLNHSTPGKDREEMGRGGGGERSEHAALLSLIKEGELRGQGQHGQDVLVKPEPGDLLHHAMDDSSGVDREGEAMNASSMSSVLPAAHQASSAALLATTAAHSGHAMLAAATSLGHPAFFEANLTSQDVADACEGSYQSQRDRALSAERSSQNGEAMSLVTRPRTPPDLSYPHGPTQLPQTAGIAEKESSAPQQPAPEKNHCSHCSKNFRTSDLLSMHIALIHTRRNYKSMLTSPPYSSSSVSPSQAGLSRRTSQSPGHQSSSSNSSRSKSQSPISVLAHSQALALSMSPAGGLQSTPSPSLSMSLPTLPSSLCSTVSSQHDPSGMTAAAIAALAQSYAFESSQVGPMMGGPGSVGAASPHQCNMCHMPFVSWPLLAQHQSQCPRRGPHRCEACSKAFRSKTSLTDHVNTIHRGVVFVCRGCRETFKWRTHIYQHKRKCPALLNLTFETGSFIEEVYPPNPPLPPEGPPPPPPPPQPPAASMMVLPLEEEVSMAPQADQNN